MEHVVARNIRSRRERAGMTQEEMANGCKVNVRTIQRIETGQGPSEDHLERIAAVLECTVAELRLDVADVAKALGVAPETVMTCFIDAKAAATLEDFDTIELRSVSTAADLNVFASVDALHFDCRLTDESVRDVAAELQQDLMDGIDIHAAMSPLQVRQYEQHLFAYVTRLRDLGARVFARAHEIVWAHGPSPVRLTVLFVSVTSDELAVRLIHKSWPTRLA